MASRPEWLQALNDAGERIIRMYFALVMPSGAFPSVGNQSYEDDRPRLTLEAWVNDRGMAGLREIYSAVHEPAANSADTARIAAPAFTSVALPYGGYYALRSGWGDDDLSLFMKSSRPGSGHRHADNNGVQVSAYGRHLLVDCAAPPYGQEFLPEHQKEDNLWFDEDRYAGSSFSACTVVVDGAGQKMPAKADPDRGYATTSGARWLSTDQFDFMEGVFNDGFESDKPLTDRDMEDLIGVYGRDRLAYMIERNNLLQSQRGVK